MPKETQIDRLDNHLRPVKVDGEPSALEISTKEVKVGNLTCNDLLVTGDVTGISSGSGDMTGVDLTAGTGISIDSETNTTSGDYSATITCNVEGTEVVSTGEGTGTKVLGEDGDGTCSWTKVTFAGIDGGAVVTESESIASNDNDTTLPTSAAVKAYADSTGFVLEDDDGTEVTINPSNEVKIIGDNLTSNWTDVDNGTDGDPYDLTLSVKIPYVIYSNFQDDLGTTKHYLPIRDVFEQTFSGTEQASMMIPFNMELQKVVMRCNEDISGATWTLGMFAVDSGTTDAHHHTTGRNWVVATGGAQHTNCTFNFTGTVGLAASASGGSNAVTAGQLISFQLFADTDVTSSSAEFWLSFLFHVDMSNTI